MKYRIKITTYWDDHKVYSAQVKRWYGWRYLFSDGEETLIDLEQRSRESSLERIDNHYAGNAIKVKIDFEYINK